MHKDSRLKLATAWFSSHLAMRNTTQFVVHRPPGVARSSWVTHARCAGWGRVNGFSTPADMPCVPSADHFTMLSIARYRFASTRAARSVHVSRVWGNFFCATGRTSTHVRADAGVGHGRHQSRHRPSDGPRMLDRRRTTHTPRGRSACVGQSTQVH